MVLKNKLNQNKNCLKRRDVVSYSPIMRLIVLFCVIVMVIILMGGIAISIQEMRSEAITAHKSVESQVSNRVDESLKLLESLAVQPEYFDSSIPPLSKVAKLDRITETYGYMMICFVDSDMNVYTIGEEPASLASREYMQQLFTTGEPQVTDSFAAGADGVTLNYTVAFPLKDKGEITGCLFCAIYFDDVINILQQASEVSSAQAVLIGSKGQIMSSTNDLEYGKPLLDYVLKAKNFNITADGLETDLMAKTPGYYWSLKKNNLSCTVYSNINNTNWDLLTTVNFWSIYRNMIPVFLLMGTLMAFACIGILIFAKKYIKQQKKVTDMLIHSIQELEEKIYHNERPDNVDFKEILSLTTNGLSDDLTGIATRTVFMKQAKSQLEKVSEERTVALCFVDLDNLKKLNDTYGHAMGDAALKSVGFILREFEKKYDGVAGRYGGDEFVLLLSDFDSKEELKCMLDGLIHKLHIDIGADDKPLWIQCSIGVAVKETDSTLEQLIANADHALYIVKQNGKAHYEIYQE